MSIETRGNDKARRVKIISSILIISSIFVGIVGFGAAGIIMFFVGFFGFIVGRFME
jgi:hypothetical protein